MVLTVIGGIGGFNRKLRYNLCPDVNHDTTPTFVAMYSSAAATSVT